MGCRGCNSSTRDRRGSCDVCTLLLGDASIKKVRYCAPCSAWICQVCRPQYSRRGIAAAIAALRSAQAACAKKIKSIFAPEP